ncbi:hypothetical protein [Lysinibacillus capsici]|uniref:hypothetical protein n=1 Tax=Lysinibacillus capsici TaxID=2115968 RepID=UPI001CDA0314|nr:hypothetical protein [Lysinibacillus capsici]
MAYSAQVFNVLIASPSDVYEERDLITNSIYKWNALNSQEEHIVLLPVRWETHASTAYNGSDTQEILNEQFVRDCDILIGVFWSKLGTATLKSSSGTLEEIEEFVDLKKPVKLYFSSQPLPHNIDIEQLIKLREFKKIYQQKGIYFEYTSLENLESLLLADITREVRRFKNPISKSEVPSRTITRFEIKDNEVKKK